LAGIVAPLLLASAVQAQELSVVNAQLDFKRFWDESKAKPQAEQLASFDKNFLTNGYESIYRGVHYQALSPAASTSMDEAQFKKLIHEDLQNYLDNYKTSGEKIAGLFKDFPALVSNQEKTFFLVFPEAKEILKRSRLLVYLVPTLGKFSGRLKQVELPISGSKKTLSVWVIAIGADTIVVNDLDPAVVFAHYLFEAYHRLNSPDRERDDSAAPLLNALWSEGLATHVSSQFNMGKSDEVIYMDRQIGQLCRKSYRDYARLFIEDSKNLNDATWEQKAGDKLRAKWFDDRQLSSKEGFDFNVPPLAGRCLGAQVARQLMRKAKMQTLVTWDFKTLKPAVEKQLEEFAKPLKSSKTKRNLLKLSRKH
jgi:hypothetical protein